MNLPIKNFLFTTLSNTKQTNKQTKETKKKLLKKIFEKKDNPLKIPSQFIITFSFLILLYVYLDFLSFIPRNHLFMYNLLLKMQEAGFEPATSKRIVPETIALDHSATLAYTH